MEIILSLLNFLANNIAIGTFLIAVLTFIITFVNFYNNRAAVTVTQNENSQSVLIKPDFIDQKTPDVYWHHDYRIISDIIITNKSSKPISIIEFVLNEKYLFNSYHLPSDEYQVTINPREVKVKGGVAFGKLKKNSYPIGKHWFSPIIDIPPQTSIRGHLFFHLHNEDDIFDKNNELKLITSRKTFITNLDIFEIHESRLPLPRNIQSARDQMIQ